MEIVAGRRIEQPPIAPTVRAGATPAAIARGHREGDGNIGKGHESTPFFTAAIAFTLLSQHLGQ